jgi:alkylation response protein AidB-like acyl-CoA dehydrogenase
MRVSEDEASGKPNPASSILKLRGSQLQQAVTELLVEVAGSDGLQVEAGGRNAAAKYLNYRKTSIYGGSNEVQRSIISATILGL